MLMLVAAGTSPASPRFWGSVLLWVGFLAHLESVHHDEGREPVPDITAWLFWLQGLAWCGRQSVADMFIVCSLLYAQKKHRPWGLISPFMRGLQTLFLLGPISGYYHWLPWIGAVAVGIRNWLGDRRDVEEDRAAKIQIQTWPVVTGQKYDELYVHLLGVLATTWLWWWFSSLSWLVPLGINLIQVRTYWWTPRPNNEKATSRLRNKILSIFQR